MTNDDDVAKDTENSHTIQKCIQDASTKRERMDSFGPSSKKEGNSRRAVHGCRAIMPLDVHKWDAKRFLHPLPVCVSHFLLLLRFPGILAAAPWQRARATWSGDLLWGKPWGRGGREWTAPSTTKQVVQLWTPEMNDEWPRHDEALVQTRLPRWKWWPWSDPGGIQRVSNGSNWCDASC